MRLNRTIAKRNNRRHQICRYVCSQEIRCRKRNDAMSSACEINVLRLLFLSDEKAKRRTTTMMIYEIQSRDFRSTYWWNKTNKNILFEISNIGIGKRISFLQIFNATKTNWNCSFIGFNRAVIHLFPYSIHSFGKKFFFSR